MQLRGKLRDGELKSGKMFRDAAKLYLREFDIMTQGQRSAKYASGRHARANGYLVQFFGNMVLPEITAGKVNEYRVHRLEECKSTRGKPPAHSTMHQEIVTLRQISKRLCGTDGSIICLTCQRPIERRPRFLTEQCVFSSAMWR